MHELEAEIERLRMELELERERSADREEDSMSYLEHRRELALVEQDLVAVAEENTQLRESGVMNAEAKRERGRRCQAQECWTGGPPRR